MWLGEVVFDQDDNITEKIKPSSPTKRISMIGMGTGSPTVKKEKEAVFDSCFALVEVCIVYIYVLMCVYMNISA